MGHDTAIFLVDKMAGDAGAQMIEFFVGFFYLLFVVADEFIFLRIDESGFKEKVPQAIGLIRTGDTTQYGNMIIVSERPPEDA